MVGYSHSGQRSMDSGATSLHRDDGVEDSDGGLEGLETECVQLAGYGKYDSSREREGTLLRPGHPICQLEALSQNICAADDLLDCYCVLWRLPW